MFKIFKMFVYGLMVLDVAILPFSCYTRKTNDGELYINYICVNENEKIEIYSDLSNYLDFSDDKILTLEVLKEQIDQYFPLNNSTLVNTETGERKIIKINSYEIEKVKLYGDNYDDELTFPYTFKTSDRTNYFYGKRNAFVIDVYLKVEYQIINENEK